MSEATAILIAAVVATTGYVLNHALGRRAERKRAEERAVTDLATAAMSIIFISRFRRGFAEGNVWRQLLPGSPPSMPKELVFKTFEFGFQRLDEIVRAHGELLQHARARLVDAATEVMDAAIVLSESWEKADRDATVAAEWKLGQARLRLLRMSRGRRSLRWWLGRPTVFNNIAEDG